MDLKNQKGAKMGSYKGINGLLTAFMKIISDFKEGTRVAFAGSVGVCTPFAELLAYAVRKKGFEMVFIPDAIIEKTKKMRMIEDIGYQATEDKGEATGSDIIVILGGLAMPSARKNVEDIKNLIKRINPDAKIIGVGFMGIFEQEGWTESIRFDTVIDSTIDPVKVIIFNEL